MKIFFALAALAIGLTEGTIMPNPMFVNEFDVRTQPGETVTFIARLCGGCLYDRTIAMISINQPNKPWSPITGALQSVVVEDQYGNRIASNVEMNYARVFTFPYHKAYGTLHLVVTTGPATGGSEYTVTLEFLPPLEETLASIPKILPTNKPLREIQGRQYNLVTVFRTTGIKEVATQDVKYLQLNYCFEQNQPGTLVISTIATDETSGLGTYVCTGKVTGECTAMKAEFMDLSGASVNFVNVKLSGKGGDLEPLKVTVYGDGKFKEKNFFRLGASKFFPASPSVGKSEL